MPLFLTHRDTRATELMDDPECDIRELRNTYRQFRVINSLVSRWHAIYRRQIRPACTSSNPDYSCTLLDIGFGGGDIPRKLALWASNDRIQLKITGIETDKRAFEFVQDLDFPDSVHFRLASSAELLREGKKFDFVISNHLLHHLDDKEFFRVLEEAKLMSTRKVLFNDIERSDIGYALFKVLARPVFRSSFITHDGLISIRRSYTYHELERKIPENWNVKRVFPYRLLLSYDHGSD